MSLGVALQTALSGLQAQQRKSAVLSRNIANATTDGYTRKEAVLQSAVIAGEGRGVEVVGIRRNADASLAREVRGQTSLNEALRAKSEAMNRFADNALGQPQEQRSVAPAVKTFELAFARLQNAPQNPIEQQAVVTAAQDVVTRLRIADTEIREGRQLADAGIAAAVTDVNQSLSQLERLNRQIAVGNATGQDVTDLEDQRDQALDRIAENIGIQYFYRNTGEVVVLTSGGQTLLDTEARQLEFTPTAFIGSTAGYPGTLSGLTVDGVDIAPRPGSPVSITGGAIAGLFQVRDQLLPQAQVQMDEIASVLVDRFQTLDVSVGPAQTGLFTDLGARHDRTVVASIQGLAGRLELNPLVRIELGGDPSLVRTGLYAPPGDVGDTTQIQQFRRAFTDVVAFRPAAQLMPSGTISAFAAEAVGYQQGVRSVASDDLTAQSLLVDTIQGQRESRDGVNIDDELQQLILVEKGYAASAQVMQAAVRMLDALMEIQQ